ncbi:MAG: DRTGG domain protein [Pelotomaculum sp. PtaU1.Bin035]|nr:MAG: DRTGG domain protein [Pelotomaculum sp. PtaU1.Bin035]
MKCNELTKLLNISLLTPDKIDPALEVSGCYCGDLLSYVMAHAKAGDVWLTIQTHQNIVAVAVLLNMPCIILVEGNMPQNDTLFKAQKEGVVLMSSQDTAYHVAGCLYSLGLGR